MFAHTCTLVLDTCNDTECCMYVYVWDAIDFHKLPTLNQGTVGPMVNEDYGDTVPSKQPNVEPQVANQISVAGFSRQQQISDDAELDAEGISMYLYTVYYVITLEESSNWTLY